MAMVRATLSLQATSGRSLVGFDGVALVPMGTDRDRDTDTDTGLGLGDSNNNSGARTNDYEEGNVEMETAAAKR